MDSETQADGSRGGAFTPRRVAGWVLFGVVVCVVVWRALEVPAPRGLRGARDGVARAVQRDGASAERRSDVARALDASAPADRLAALEQQRPRATPRLANDRPPRSDALPDAVTRASLSARYERAFDAGTPHAFWLHRASRRVSWARPAAGARWDFAQHPLDPRRLQATLSLDTQRVVLDLALADLHDERLPTAWADASLGGFTSRELEAMRPTGAAREAFGLRFEELRPAGEASALRELWWHAELQLALEWRRRTPDGEEHQVLRELSRPALADAVLAPDARHPDWPRADAIDFREALSER